MSMEWDVHMDWRKRDIAVAVGLLVVYLSIMTFLALTVDRRFFINDGLSLAFWLAVGGAIAFGGARMSRRG